MNQPSPKPSPNPSPTANSVSVYMRLGDGPEYRIGEVRVTDTAGASGRLTTALAELFRAAALELVLDHHDPPAPSPVDSAGATEDES